MTAALKIMEEQESQNQPKQNNSEDNRRHISRYLTVMANDPDYADTLDALVANRGNGKIELTYIDGRLEHVDFIRRFK